MECGKFSPVGVVEVPHLIQAFTDSRRGASEGEIAEEKLELAVGVFHTAWLLNTCIIQIS